MHWKKLHINKQGQSPLLWLPAFGSGAHMQRQHMQLTVAFATRNTHLNLRVFSTMHCPLPLHNMTSRPCNPFVCSVAFNAGFLTRW